MEYVLKDCPCCGSSGIALIRCTSMYWVECIDCDTDSDGHIDMTLAIRQWNERENI